MGYTRNCGNQSLGCKSGYALLELCLTEREKLSSRNYEVRVPMPRTGADWFVVVLKVGNATGAKGSS